MTKFKKFAAFGVTALIIGATSITAFAVSNYSTPAEAAAGVTGKSVQSVIDERSQTGKTYGTIANDAGKLAEFKAEILAIKKDALAKKVAAGTMTQERADEIIAALEANQANCDGTGSARIGQKMGAGFGGMNGNGNGQGRGQGGAGRGMGNQGSCLIQ
ncbi:MAG: DUF2680 domain-containing protein [Sphingobacteriia bacterium]|nr:DUF2680 domain-containing protein [Sphingobacteriia bacterium]